MFENLKKKKKINREQQSKHTISLHKSAIHPYLNYVCTFGLLRN